MMTSFHLLERARPITDTTVGNILKSHGIEPTPCRKTTGSWSTFIKAHWDTLAAIDFTTVETWISSGLTTFYLLFAMELNTRKVHFAGCSVHPNEAWMKQTARELTNHFDGFLLNTNYLIMDRDTKFCESFRAFLSDEGVKPVRLPPRSPNFNAHLERFFRSLKAECLDRLILFGEKAMCNAVREYLAHYHTERNHQGLDNELIVPLERPPDFETEVKTTERLGGLLHSYHLSEILSGERRRKIDSGQRSSLDQAVCATKDKIPSSIVGNSWMPSTMSPST